MSCYDIAPMRSVRVLLYRRKRSTVDEAGYVVTGYGYKRAVLANDTQQIDSIPVDAMSFLLINCAKDCTCSSIDLAGLCHIPGLFN